MAKNVPAVSKANHPDIAYLEDQEIHKYNNIYNWSRGRWYKAALKIGLPTDYNSVTRYIFLTRTILERNHGLDDNGWHFNAKAYNAIETLSRFQDGGSRSNQQLVKQRVLDAVSEPVFGNYLKSNHGKHALDQMEEQSWVNFFTQNENRGFNIPGTNYIGPGSDLNKNYKPYGWIDQIAYEHDKAYSAAKFQEDIEDADKKMLEQLNNPPKTFSGKDYLPHLIAKSGIWLKSKFEKKFGVAYPGKLPKRPLPEAKKTPLDPQSQVPNRYQEHVNNDQTPMGKAPSAIETPPDSNPKKTINRPPVVEKIKPKIPFKPIEEVAELGATTRGGVETSGARGSYHGTHEEIDSKQRKYHNVTTIQTRQTGSFEYHWGNKFVGAIYDTTQNYNYDAHHDQIVANSFTPTIGMFMDSRLMNTFAYNNTGGVYNRFKLKKITFKGHFVNIPKDLLEQAHRYENFYRTPPDQRKSKCFIDQQPCGDFTVLTFNTHMDPWWTQIDNGPIKFKELVAPSLNTTSRVAPAEFVIQRDIYGQRAHTGDIAPPPTIDHVSDPKKHHTLRTLLNEEGEFVIGDKIEFTYDLNVPENRYLSAVKLRSMKLQNKPLTTVINAFESGNVTDSTGYLTTQREFFHFFFAPTKPMSYDYPCSANRLFPIYLYRTMIYYSTYATWECYDFQYPLPDPTVLKLNQELREEDKRKIQKMDLDVDHWYRVRDVTEHSEKPEFHHSAIHLLPESHSTEVRLEDCIC